MRIHALLLLYLVAREDDHVPPAGVQHAPLLITQPLHGYGDALGDSDTRIIELIGLYVRTRLSPKRVDMSMNRLGFEARRTKYSRGWIAVTLTGDEIKSAQRLNAHYSSKEE